MQHAGGLFETADSSGMAATSWLGAAGSDVRGSIRLVLSYLARTGNARALPCGEPEGSNLVDCIG
jgi:hypothetical protein